MALVIIGLSYHVISNFVFALDMLIFEMVSSDHVVYLPVIEVLEYCHEQAVDNGVTLPI